MLSQRQIQAAWRPRCTGPYALIEYPGGGRVYVRPAAAEAFRAKATVYRHFNYRTRRADTGGGVCRTTASGADSNHAYWIADDTNWQSNPAGTTRTDRPRGMNQAIVAIRTNNGKQVFNNGIFWRSFKDPMHDEIVCSPQDLATGIDWSTVAGHSVQIDWAALRRWNAGILLPKIQEMRTRVPTDNWYSLDIRTLQEALNVHFNASIKVDGQYGDVTWLHVVRLQRDVERMFGRQYMKDQLGVFGNYSKLFLAAALQNIRDGKA